MAIEIGRIGSIRENPTQTNQNILGIGYPFDSSNSSVFSYNVDTLSQKVSNLINVITTQKGERLFNPNFGSRVLSFLFEPLNEEYLDRIEREIRNAASTFVPELTIERVNVLSDPATNVVSLSIQVSLEALRKLKSKKTVTVELILDDEGNVFTRLSNDNLRYNES